jgi:hypothetical protein
MPTCVTYALSLAIMATGSLVFAGDFEGVIHMKHTFGVGEEAKISESDWLIKGDHIRMERRAKSGVETSDDRTSTIIFNADKKMMYVLMPERKMYVEHSSDDTFGKTAEHLKDLRYEIVRTGRTDTVAGYRCEIFQNRSKETGKIRGESCAVKGLANMGAFMGLNRSDAGRLSGDIPSELRQIVKEGYFLVRMVTMDDDGSAKMRMEATGVDRKRIDSSLFVPPVDYTKFDMNLMMQERAKASSESGKTGRRQPDPNMQQMIQEMKKRKADGSSGSTGSDPSGQQMRDLMNNIQEMMKKQEQSGQ